MRDALNQLMSPVISAAAKSWVALVVTVAAALCLSTPAAHASGAPLPIVVNGATVQLAPLTSGGWDGSQSPLSGTFAVGPNGDVIIGNGYSSNIYQITPGGVETTLTAVIGGSAVAIDSNGNAYAGGYYSNSIFKIPYNAATGTYAGFTSAPTSACLGGTKDQAACIFAPGAQYGGYADLAFDAQGDLFIATGTVPSTNPNTIYECNTACIASPTGTPKLIYTDPNPMGALAIDPWGNLFFTDGNNSSNKVTNLNELPLQSGVYASSPTVLESYTNKAGYNNGFSGVAAGSNGTIYFSTNGDGIFAIPNTQTDGPNVAGLYLASTVGGKGIALDSKGNLYQIPYNGGDVVDMIPSGSLTLAATALGGTAATATATIIDSNGGCIPTLTLAVTEFGASTSEFTAAAGSSCGGGLGTSNGTWSPAVTLTGSVTSATITFNPKQPGSRNAAFKVTDTTAALVGMAAVTGIGQSALANLDPGVWTAYSTGLKTPASIVADAEGEVFVADSGAGKVFEIAAGSTTPVAIGSGFTTPDALALDANGDLFIADSGVPDVVEIRNLSANGVFAAGAQLTVISADTAFGGTVLATPTALAMGPDGTLYITDAGNKRVVGYNLANGLPLTTLADAANGLENPMGIAVDGAGSLYVADASLNEVLIFSNAGIATVTPPNVTQAVGVAVDASGSLLVADGSTGNIVRVPNVSGALTTSKAITIEVAPSQTSSLSIDSAGNLYAASSSGSSAYAIQRSAAAINLGSVQDGATNAGTVYLMNAGNVAATLASPAVTQPANTMFTLVAPGTGGCDDGSSGPAGADCVLTATFAPPVGTPDGAQTGTATVSFSVPAFSATVTMNGTASISSIQSQTITGFSPNTPILVGRQLALTATGGGSGNPIVFTIDPSSTCPACATISGTTLTAVSAGTVIVDANQAAGTNNGVQYAKAAQVQATVVINNATATGVPGLIMTQENWLAGFPANSGAFAQDSAAGSSLGVNQQGNVVLGTAYGGAVEIYNSQAGTLTSLGKYGKYGNTGGVAVDSAGNAYLGALYSNIIAKIPYNKGAYSAVTDATSGTAPANCTGTDTAECVVAPVAAVGGIGGVSAMTFDAAGDLFIGTDDQGTNPWSIWECTAACLSTGSPAPVMVYQEPAGNNASTTVGQLYTGGLAVDPWGNLFFTDSYLVDQSNNTSKSNYSDLYELAYTAGTGYAATPTLLETFTDTTPGGYDDELDGVAVTSNGTVYYTTQYDGIFAIPNTQSGGPKIADQYAVTGQGAKEMALDADGNIYFVSYHGSGDTLGEILVGDLTTPVAQLSGAPVTASAAVTDNAFGCGSAAVLSFASSNTEFSATAGTTCSSIAVSSGNGTLSTALSAASSYPATITFAATKGGPQTATLNASDTANGGTGTATVTGVGQETSQAITFTAPTTTTSIYSPTLTITLGATGGASNNAIVFTVDGASTGAGSITGNTLTITQAGSIIIDANQAGGLVNGIYYSAAPQAQLTLTVNQAAQAISFTPPATPVTYSSGLTITLTATGGASGNAVTFTVDAGSTGAGTVSGNVLTVTTAGTIVIDANQASTANYSAAPQVQQTVVVNQASQAITFTPPSAPVHFIAGGITITLVATGGASGNAVVFTVDPSSTGVGTVSGNILTVTALGNLVIDANQAGNANYLAAPQAQETIAVLSALPTQTISFANPGTQVVGTPLTLTATATSGFAVSFASGTASVCTVAQSGSAWSAAFLTSGTCTITATQPGDNATFAAAPPVSQSFTVNATGVLPGINLSLSLSSITLQSGTVGLTQLTVNSQNNFTGTVSFACSGLPSGYTCTFNPNPITVAQGAGASTSLSINPSATAAMNRHDARPLLPMTALAASLCLFGFRKKNRLKLLLLVAFSLAGLGLFSGCGGSSSGSSSAKATTSTATITATSGSVKQSATLTVIVE